MRPQLCLLLALVFGSTVGKAGQGLPPVNVNISNVTQETPVWCWAAVAQQMIAAAAGRAQTPPQCALVAMANGAPPATCCSGYNPACLVTGSWPQIAGLIQRFGGTSTLYATPTDPMTLYRTLQSGRAILLQVRSGYANSHVVVLRGMSFMQTGYGVEPVLHINDPMSYFTQPVPYSRLVPMWMDALVVDVPRRY